MVWPGVCMMVMVVSPSVSFWPSPASMSRLGMPPGLFFTCNGIPVRRAHDDARAITVLDQLGAFIMIAMGVADDQILMSAGLRPTFFIPSTISASTA
jgi:hypothetical protein